MTEKLIIQMDGRKNLENQHFIKMNSNNLEKMVY